MELKLDGSLRKDEFLQAVKLGNHPIAKNSQFKMDLWTLLLLAGGAIIAISVGEIIVNPDYYLLALLGAIIGAILVTVGLKVRAAISQIWDKNEAIRARREGLVTDEYIELRNLAGQSRLQWSALSGYGEIQDIIVLYQGVTLALPITKRFFGTETEWLQFKSLVAERLPLTHRINPMSRGNLLAWLLIIVAAVLLAVQLSRGTK
jgi:hypothetical protein